MEYYLLLYLFLYDIFSIIKVFDGSNDPTGTIQGHYITSMSSYILIITVVMIKPILEVQLLTLTHLIIVTITYVYMLTILFLLCKSYFARTIEPTIVHSV